MLLPRALVAVLVHVLAGVLAPAPAAAQPGSAPARPFLFSVSTPHRDRPAMDVFVDTGFGERAFDLVQGEAPEQRVGIQAALGGRLTVVARLGLADERDGVRSSQQGELLYGLVQSPTRRTSLAVGMGMRHEAQGVNVLLGRLVAGRSFAAWRLDGNALFEKPFAADRDRVDLITTVGVARRVTPAFHVGVELIGQDLEGFWEEDEAEGGARVLIGPSLRVAPPEARWQFAIAGGPVLHATRSTRIVPLPPGRQREGFAVRCAVTYGM
ncbi:MAG: hypothetical protein ABIT71_10745 [Vicinamibacteraceae bacterium]